jgi:hypothetical protein
MQGDHTGIEGHTTGYAFDCGYDTDAAVAIAAGAALEREYILHPPINRNGPQERMKDNGDAPQIPSTTGRCRGLCCPPASGDSSTSYMT